MYHLADMTKCTTVEAGQCQIGMAFQCMVILGKQAVFIVVYRRGYALCQQVDGLRLPAVRYRDLINNVKSRRYDMCHIRYSPFIT